MRNNDFRYMRYIGEHYFDNRFASKNEVKRQLEEFNFNNSKHKLNSGGTPLISDGKIAWVDDKDEHTLIVGSTGSMKTRGFILPTIISLAQAGENMVVSDPKGELFEYTSGYLSKLGYKINVLNFRNLCESNCWNPLHEAYAAYKNGDLDTAKLLLFDITNIIMSEELNKCKEPFWPMAARDFLYSCLQLMVFTANDESEINFAGLSGFLSRAYAKSSKESNEFSSFVDALPDYSPLKSNLSQVVLNADTTKRGILGYVSSSTSIFLRSANLNKVISYNEINLHEYANDKNKIITYIIVPDEKTSFHFFCSLFVKQLYEILIKEASKLSSRCLKRRTNFLLDEFANIPAIPDMSNMISAARSRNIRFFIVLQSNAQLKRKYGVEEANNIKTNCQTWCFLNSKEMELIKEVQEYIGYDSHEYGKPLISTGELSLLKKKWPYVESIILMSRFRPFMSTLSDISLYDCVWKDGKPKYPAIKIQTNIPKLIIFNFAEHITSPFEENKIKFIYDLMQLDQTPMTESDLELLKNKLDEDDDPFDFMDFNQPIRKHKKPKKEDKIGSKLEEESKKRIEREIKVDDIMPNLEDTDEGGKEILDPKGDKDLTDIIDNFITKKKGNK